MKPTEPHGAPPNGPSAGGYDDGVARHHGEHDELHNPEVAHEHSDVNIRAIGTAAGIIALVVVVTQVLMWLLFGWFERDALGKDPQLSPVAAPPVQMPATTTESPFFGPPGDGVQLLTSEPMALESHRREERQRLGNYGWVDEKTGVVHIPIEEAKKLILERGLPVREFDLVEPEVGTRVHAAGEASAGRSVTGMLPQAADAGPEAPVDDTAPQPDGQPAAPGGTEKPQDQGGH